MPLTQHDEFLTTSGCTTNGTISSYTTAQEILSSMPSGLAHALDFGVLDSAIRFNGDSVLTTEPYKDYKASRVDGVNIIEFDLYYKLEI